MPANDIHSVLARLGYASRPPAPEAAPHRVSPRSQRDLVKASLLCKPES